MGMESSAALDPFPPKPGFLRPAVRDRPYHDRRDAGRQLAARLTDYASLPGVIVLGLPRGGVPVAAEVAMALQAPLDVFLVRKLGVPGHEELAMGAIATGEVQILNQELVAELAISEEEIATVAAREATELARQEQHYRGSRSTPAVADKIVILVDDGLATGATMRAAAAALRLERPRRLVVAVPVASATVCAGLRAEVDEVVCAKTPDPFYAVGLWYEDFRPTSDGEVKAAVAQSPAGLPAASP